MKNALIIVLFTLSTAVSAATYYIDPSGNNANNGSASFPWKTLAYACTKVTIPGDIIHINAGTYTETSQSVLAVGVSIEGAGDASWIKSHVSGMATILLSSVTEGTDGNQHISNIKMDGSALTGFQAISVLRRKNVSIHDCTFIDFSREGVSFEGGSADAAPSIYATGNSFYNNVITNCAGYASGIGGYGNLHVSGSEGMLIYNNTITATGRAQGSNGVCIKSVNEIGSLRNVKIYNNTLQTDQTLGDDQSNSYKFALELWGGQGVEIYNNNIYGTIDIAGRTWSKGSYNFSISVHNNFIGSINSTSVYLMGFDIEATISTDEVLIYDNLIKNVNRGITFLPTASASYTNVKIYYNIFDQIGHNESGYGAYPAYGFKAGSGTASVINYFYFYNNVFIASTYGGALQADAIEIPCKSGVTLSYWYIQNNIMIGWNEAAIFTKPDGTIDHLIISNNITYGNVANISLPVTPTNYTNANNLTSNPLFVSSSDFHLQAGSPAISKGLRITGITTDYTGNILKNPPCIGAYEYGSIITSPVIPAYQSSVVANATPTLIEMTYDLSLDASIVPAASSYNILVNSVTAPISKVAISGIKVQLTLSSAIKYGDIITVSYTKPVTNALQTTTGGVAASITTKNIINNLTAPTKDGTTVTVTMTISPNHVHKIMNVILAYSSTPTTTMTPELIRISNISGTLFIEQLLVTGVTNIKIPLNLNSGIYIVKMLANGLEMASQKMIVY